MWGPHGCDHGDYGVGVAATSMRLRACVYECWVKPVEKFLKEASIESLPLWFFCHIMFVILCFPHSQACNIHCTSSLYLILSSTKLI